MSAGCPAIGSVSWPGRSGACSSRPCAAPAAIWAPNLGAVELTVAMHRVFGSPWDRIVFDTGHRAYTDKILTGRREGLDSLRQAGGVSGFPDRTESDHDLVDDSHTSTALSYA